MTIVVAVIAKPKGKRKPFALIASDTRGLNLVEGELVVSDSVKKIFPFGNMYLGLAGAVPIDLFEDLPETIEDLYLSFNEACEWLCRELTNYLNKYDPVEINPSTQYLRLTMILVSVENNTPKLAEFEYDTRKEEEMLCIRKGISEEYGTKGVCYIGNRQETIAQQELFIKELISFGEKINVLNAKRAMKKFMNETADVYPDKCNKVFDSYQIEGE